MIYWAIVVLCIIHWLFQALKQKTFFYGMNVMYIITSVIMALFASSNWYPIYIMRYFLYIISALLIVIVPFILLVLAIIMVKKTYGKTISLYQRIQNFVFSMILMIFCIFSLWNMINIREVQFPIIVSLYSQIAVYLTAQFISYVMVSAIMSRGSSKRDYRLIVILGSDIDDDGNVQSDLRHRLNKALDEYQSCETAQQKMIYFLVSGGNPTINGKTEAEGMAAYLMAHNIPRERIIKEPSAQNTYENFLYMQPIFRHFARNKSVLVVTSFYHLIRSQYFAMQLGIKVHYTGSRSSWFLMPYAIVREYLALMLLNKEINMIYMACIVIIELSKILN